MRQLRIVLLLVPMVATGCIYARGKGTGTNTGSGADKQQGGPWTQGDPPAFAPDR